VAPRRVAAHRIGAVALSAALCACGRKDREPAVVADPPSGAPDKHDFPSAEGLRRGQDAGWLDFDGIRIGDSFASVATRPPYDAPCREQDVDARTRAVIYAGTGCERQFPEGATVIFFVGTDPARTIRATAWMGRDYFGPRSHRRLPTSIGFEAAEGIDGMGEPESMFPVTEAPIGRRRCGRSWTARSRDVASMRRGPPSNAR
jgi:hypothetical protein